MSKRKFKVGDIVKVKKVLGFNKSGWTKEEKDWIEKNRKGIVTKIIYIIKDDHSYRPYIYKLAVKGTSSWGSTISCFSARELELIEDTAEYKQTELLEKIKQLWERQDYVRSVNGV